MLSKQNNCRDWHYGSDVDVAIFPTLGEGLQKRLRGRGLACGEWLIFEFSEKRKTHCYWKKERFFSPKLCVPAVLADADDKLERAPV